MLSTIMLCASILYNVRYYYANYCTYVIMQGEHVPDAWNCYPWDAAAYGRHGKKIRAPSQSPPNLIYHIIPLYLLLYPSISLSLHLPIPTRPRHLRARGAGARVRR